MYRYCNRRKTPERSERQQDEAKVKWPNVLCIVNYVTDWVTKLVLVNEDPSLSTSQSPSQSVSGWACHSTFSKCFKEGVTRWVTLSTRESLREKIRKILNDRVTHKISKPAFEWMRKLIINLKDRLAERMETHRNQILKIKASDVCAGESRLAVLHCGCELTKAQTCGCKSWQFR
jgi:hypothetical protein